MTTALKLSQAMVDALQEIHYRQGVPQNAKPNTIKALLSRELIREIGGTYTLTPEARSAVNLPSEPVLTNEDAVESIQNELNTNMWDDPEVTVEEVQAFTKMKESLECEAPLSDGVEYYQDHWAMWEKELAGFGETLKWSNTQVWDGLTAEEIREDMDTEGPVNRTERRKAQRARRNFLRMVEGKGGRNRKQIKLCGGKG